MSSKEEPLVSVLTPVYNGDKFLSECIESVLSQTYSNFEYIIVNNCSSDKSLEIAERYSRVDQRIRLISRDELLKPLNNFNNMLKQISPESRYCKEVHADDWIFSDCLEKMVALADKNPSVGIVGSYRLVGKKVKSTGLHYQKRVLKGRDASRMNLLDGPYTFGSPSALLIRSDLVREKEQFYNEDHSSADTEVCHELLQKCDFGFVHQVLTYSRVHDEAISTANKYLSTDIANLFGIFIKYGPSVLSTIEYEKGIQKKLKEYYRFLGSNLFSNRDNIFWSYHKSTLAENGNAFNWLKVFFGWCFISLRSALDTKQNVKSFYKLIKIR